ncbi:MAG: Hpt domain-containing protein, partial [Pseudomonadota bacterium]
MSNTEQFKQTYITECFELLSDMEAQLLELDLENPDKEQLNAIFRCAHSIKGGAGAFGLDYITEFTHILEAVLDSMRDGNIYPDAEIVDVLLKSVDVLNKMVTAAQNDTKPKAGIASSLIKQLHIISNSNQAPKIQSKISVGNNKNYKIRFFPHTNIFASGNEPLLILRELSSLGKAEINIDFSKLPDFEFINPIECFIGWNIDLVSKESIEKIYEVFEFVSD